MPQNMQRRESVTTGHVVELGQVTISLRFNGLPEDHAEKCCGDFLGRQVGLSAMEKWLMSDILPGG